jgi:hypothetical protein
MSVAIILVAVSGPIFFTVIVKVKVSPSLGVAEFTVFVTERSVEEAVLQFIVQQLQIG